PCALPISHAVAERVTHLLAVDLIGLQLPGAQLPRDIIDGIGHQLLGDEGDAAFQNSEDEQEEGKGEDGKLDGGSATALPSEPAEEAATGRRSPHPGLALRSIHAPKPHSSHAAASIARPGFLPVFRAGKMRPSGSMDRQPSGGSAIPSWR